MIASLLDNVRDLLSVLSLVVCACIIQEATTRSIPSACKGCGVGDWTFGSSPYLRKCSLTRLQDLNERKTSILEGVGWSLRSASSKTKTFGDKRCLIRVAEGGEWSPRSASSMTKTFGDGEYRLRSAEGDEQLLRCASSKTGTFGKRDRLRERR